jgi:hypothetical protein
VGVARECGFELTILLDIARSLQVGVAEEMDQVEKSLLETMSLMTALERQLRVTGPVAAMAA